MYHLVRMAFLLSVGFFSFHINAVASNEDINELIKYSGIDRQFDGMPGIVEAVLNQAQADAVKQGKNPIPENEFFNLKQALMHAFKPAVIVKKIRKDLRKELTIDDVDDLMRWYKSDLGRKITSEEVKASSPDAYMDMMNNIESLTKDQDRINMAFDIEHQVDSVDMATTLQKKTLLGIYTALFSRNDPASFDVKLVQSMIDSQEKVIRSQLEQTVILSYVYSYRSISLDDQSRYVSFLKRTTSKKFMKTVNNGLMHGLDKITDNLKIILQNMIQKKQK